MYLGDESSTLLFKIEPEHWILQLKSFLFFLNMLPEHELQEIDDDEKII